MLQEELLVGALIHSINSFVCLGFLAQWGWSHLLQWCCCHCDKSGQWEFEQAEEDTTSSNGQACGLPMHWCKAAWPGKAPAPRSSPPCPPRTTGCLACCAITLCSWRRWDPSESEDVLWYYVCTSWEALPGWWWDLVPYRNQRHLYLFLLASDLK